MKFKIHFIQRFSLVVYFFCISHNTFAAGLLGIYPKGLKPNGLIFASSVFLAIIIALAVHELGHLITGLVQGFRLELFVVFLLGIKRTDKGLHIYMNKNLGYMGGIAAMTPRTKSADNRKKFARSVLAGPVFSLLFSIVCFLFLIFTRNLLWTFWLVAGASSIGLFLATTIPKKSGIFFTDRARFQRLISKGQEGKSEEALLELIAQTTVDSSCKNISLVSAQVLQNDKEPIMRFWGYYYEYEYFKANDNILQQQQAKEQLLKLKESISKPIWKVLKLDEE